MQELFVNQIWQLSEVKYRILNISAELDEIFWIDIDDEKRLPESIEISHFEQLYESKNISLIKNQDTYNDPDLYSDKSLEKWERHWEIVEAVRGEEPLIFTSDYFNKRCKQLAERFNTSRQTVRRILLKYWKRGKTKLAILSDLNNSGGKGKTRAVKGKKRGRPNKYTENEVSVDDKVRKLLEAAYEKFYLKISQASLETAYKHFLSVKYSKEVKQDDMSLVPSFTQFRYWGEKKFSVEQRKKGKFGTKIFNKDLRTTKESSLINVVGPGSLYQIDSTCADIELVSSQDRSIPIGSPTTYFVSDVFSRAITGVLVTLEEPSYYVGARAIYNSVISKRLLCEQEGLIGINDFTIDDSEWPCNSLPDAIVADRAELIGKQSNNIIRDLGITIENTAAYRPDLKGVVENHFKVLHSRIKGLKRNSGFKPLNHKQRGVRDARKDAILTLKEYYTMLIKEVICYNNSVLENYPLDVDMINDKVSKVPKALWNWGIINRSGRLRSNDIAHLRQKFLPKGKGKLNKDGIEFKKAWYNVPPKAGIINKQLLLQDKRLTVDVSYDPFNISKVYFNYDSEIVECELSTSRSPLAIKSNIWELEEHLEVIKRQEYEDNKKHNVESIDSLTFANDVLNEAKKQRKKKKNSNTEAKGIRQNKNKEKVVNRAEAINRETPPKEAKIVPINSDAMDSSKNDKLDFFRKLMDND